MDRVKNLLKKIYRDRYLTLADLPQWGEKIDAQVQRYIQTLKFELEVRRYSAILFCLMHARSKEEINILLASSLRGTWRNLGRSPEHQMFTPVSIIK